MKKVKLKVKSCAGKGKKGCCFTNMPTCIKKAA